MKQKNILYIDIDTMSPNHMSCYGYNRQTTPNLDKLTRENSCAVFENMYTSDAPCLPSRTSLTTGQFGIRHGVTNHGGKYSELRNECEGRSFMRCLEYDSLFGVLKRAGKRTVSISSFSARHSAWHFNAGFNEVYCYGDSAVQQAPEIHQITEKWFNDNKDSENWFLHYHLWDPHTPYRVPESYHPEFLDQELDFFVDEEILAKHRKCIGPHTATSLNMYDTENHTGFKRALGTINDLDDLKTVLDGYDVGIHYADYHIGKLIDKLKENGMFNDTIIIVTADHGENLGELGMYSEHGTADVATCRIPFIVNVPGSNIGDIKFDKLHYNIDILPTIAELYDIKPQLEEIAMGGKGISAEIETDGVIPKHKIWDGKSFLSSFKDRKDVGHDYLVLSQMSHVLQRSVIFDKYLYIQTYHSGYHLHFEPEMLYDISTDMHEQENIAKSQPEIVKEAKSILFDWTNQQMASLEFGHCEDPLWYIYSHEGPYHAKNSDHDKFVKKLTSAGLEEMAEAVKKYDPRLF